MQPNNDIRQTDPNPHVGRLSGTPSAVTNANLVEMAA